MGEDGNCDECSGLLHCHYFLYAYPCLCCSHLHTDMSHFHPHEGILYVRIQHLVSQKWALSSDIINGGGGQKSGGWVLSKIPPPQISPVFRGFPPVFPRFPSVFPRFPPFFPVPPRFSLLPGTKRRLGTGTLDPYPLGKRRWILEASDCTLVCDSRMPVGGQGSGQGERLVAWTQAEHQLQGNGLGDTPLGTRVN